MLYKLCDHDLFMVQLLCTETTWLKPAAKEVNTNLEKKLVELSKEDFSLALIKSVQKLISLLLHLKKSTLIYSSLGAAADISEPKQRQLRRKRKRHLKI